MLDVGPRPWPLRLFNLQAQARQGFHTMPRGLGMGLEGGW